MQSTGQTSTQERSLMSMQGSAMMYVTASRLTARGGLVDQLVHELRRALRKRRLRHDLVETRLVGVAQAGRVLVVRKAEQRRVGIGVRDLVGIDSRDVRDHEVGRFDTVGCDQVVPGEGRLELAAKEELDAGQQDGRHAASRVTPGSSL